MDGIHYNVIEKRISFYDQIEERIRDYQRRANGEPPKEKPTKEKSPLPPEEKHGNKSLPSESNNSQKSDLDHYFHF